MGSETRARLALAALLFATLASFSQLFDGDAHFGPALLGAVLATAVAIGARRVGATTPLLLTLSGAALFWYLAVVFATRDLFYGLPTPAAGATLARAVARARDAALLDFAPVPARPGYVLMLVLGVWLTATLAELATFRWRRPLLASVGPAALVSVVLVMGTTRGSTFIVLLFLACLLTFWGLESSHRLRSWGRWVTPWEHRSEEPESLTGPLARKMGASCLAAALVAPLLLPALDRGLLAWRSGLGGGPGLGTAERIDLLVSLAPTLVNQSDQELFRVNPDRPTYWRLTSLAKFDGKDWVPSAADLDRAPLGRLPTYEDPELRRVNLTQRFPSTGLGDELMPAAASPTYVRFDDGE